MIKMIYLPEYWILRSDSWTNKDINTFVLDWNQNYTHFCAISPSLMDLILVKLSDKEIQFPLFDVKWSVGYPESCSYQTKFNHDVIWSKMCLRICFGVGQIFINFFCSTLLHLAPPCSSLLRSRSGAAPEQLLHFCLLIWWLYVCCSGAAPLWLLWPWISEGEKELLRSQMRSSPPNFPIVSDLRMLRKLKYLDLISFQVNISWPLQTIEG